MESWSKEEGGRLEVILEEEENVIVMQEDVHILQVKGKEIVNHIVQTEEEYSIVESNEEDWHDRDIWSKISDNDLKINDWFARIEYSKLSEKESYEVESELESYTETSEGEYSSFDSYRETFESFFT